MKKCRKVNRVGYFLWACSVCGVEYPLRRDAIDCCYKKKEGKGD